MLQELYFREPYFSTVLTRAFWGAAVQTFLSPNPTFKRKTFVVRTFTAWDDPLDFVSRVPSQDDIPVVCPISIPVSLCAARVSVRPKHRDIKRVFVEVCQPEMGSKIALERDDVRRRWVAGVDTG